jgi:DNA-binding GntR family transcriptional regulator
MPNPGGRLARRGESYGPRSRDHGDEPAQRPPSLAEHVCQVIREDILTGRQPAGARLTEAMVMQRTGVSRTPVREGLRTLEGEGLVVTYRSRGTFVTYRLTPDEAMVLYDVRLALEPELTALAAERMTPESLTRIGHVLDRFLDAVDAAESADAADPREAADPRDAGDLDADFHLAIYEASGSELLSVLRGYWTRLQLELSERVYDTELPRRFVDEHVDIYRALQAADGSLARRRMTAHIEHGKATLARALRAGERAGRR